MANTVQNATYNHTAQIGFLYKDLTFANAAGLYSLGWVPPNSTVLRGGISISTVFNYGTNNRLNIGYRNASGKSDDTDEFATLLVLTTAGTLATDEMATAADMLFPLGGEMVVDLDVTGTAGTTGAVRVWVEYIAPVNTVV